MILKRTPSTRILGGARMLIGSGVKPSCWGTSTVRYMAVVDFIGLARRALASTILATLAVDGLVPVSAVDPY